MPETLEKLRPDRDLQCYWQRPSAIAAMSESSPSGFTVSGTWLQQFDWAVIEWNRDNTFEHPLFRNLPDGDLSGLHLSYEEVRTNCIPMDSDLYPTVEWPYLRIWADANGTEQFYKVPLRRYAAGAGTCEPAWAEFELQGTPTAGDYVGLSCLTEHHTYQLLGADSLADAIHAVVESVNNFSTRLRATQDGEKIRLFSIRPGETIETSTSGANGNRIGVYGFVSGSGTEAWQPQWQSLKGGVSPEKWKVDLDFSDLHDTEGNLVPTSSVRKMRWTYAADLRDGAFQRTEFAVTVSNWTVEGAGRAYAVAGPGSRRIEDDAAEVTYSGDWQSAAGNFSGGSIRFTTHPQTSVRISYRSPFTHWLYLGTRKFYNGAGISISIDGQAARSESLRIAGEDVLVRVPLGQCEGGDHCITLTHEGPEGTVFWFDFLELALPAADLPSVLADPRYALATDWDTDHSMALSPERVARIISSLGFHGRVNHYAGALWFYGLTRTGGRYASGTVEFTGTPEFGESTQITIGRADQPPTSNATIPHLHRIGDTAETIARAFEMEINSGYTAIRAESQGNKLTIYAREIGGDGNNVTLSASPSAGGFRAVTSGPLLSGGADGEWRTDLAAAPRLNRAVRDWSRSFYAALKDHGLTVAAAFSMELQHGDPSLAAGLAQRYPSGNPVLLNTPALQTNFSPVSLEFWKQVYLDMAEIMREAGQAPYLQFGEVQWWYFPENGSGMPFYDAYSTDMFRSVYGRDMTVITGSELPSAVGEECEFLQKLVGNFTTAIISFVRQELPDCKFEVLYPLDVNDTPINSVVNLPAEWKVEALDCFKTESFTYTYSRDLEKCKKSIRLGKDRGFPASKSSHLIGISDPKSPWMKEGRLAVAEQLESIVLFALDQFCLIGYPAPLPKGMNRSLFMG